MGTYGTPKIWGTLGPLTIVLWMKFIGMRWKLYRHGELHLPGAWIDVGQLCIVAVHPWISTTPAINLRIALHSYARHKHAAAVSSGGGVGWSAHYDTRQVQCIMHTARRRRWRWRRCTLSPRRTADEYCHWLSFEHAHALWGKSTSRHMPAKCRVAYVAHAVVISSNNVTLMALSDANGDV